KRWVRGREWRTGDPLQSVGCRDEHRRRRLEIGAARLRLWRCYEEGNCDSAPSEQEPCGVPAWITDRVVRERTAGAGARFRDPGTTRKSKWPADDFAADIGKPNSN